MRISNWHLGYVPQTFMTFYRDFRASSFTFRYATKIHNRTATYYRANVVTSSC